MPLTVIGRPLTVFRLLVVLRSLIGWVFFLIMVDIRIKTRYTCSTAAILLSSIFIPTNTLLWSTTEFSANVCCERLFAWSVWRPTSVDWFSSAEFGSKIGLPCGIAQRVRSWSMLYTRWMNGCFGANLGLIPFDFGYFCSHAAHSKYSFLCNLCKNRDVPFFSRGIFYDFLWNSQCITCVFLQSDFWETRGFIQ